MGAKQYFFCRKLDFDKNAKKLNFDFLLNTHRFFLSIELSIGFRPLRIRWRCFHDLGVVFYICEMPVVSEKQHVDWKSSPVFTPISRLSWTERDEEVKEGEKLSVDAQMTHENFWISHRSYLELSRTMSHASQHATPTWYQARNDIATSRLNVKTKYFEKKVKNRFFF
jgi:hypothetical protein